MRTPRGLPTGSKLELALACAASQALGQVDTSFKAGEDGKAKHAALAGRLSWMVDAGAWDCPENDLDDSPKTVEWLTTDTAIWGDMSEATARWLASIDHETLLPLKGCRDEVALAWDYQHDAGRELGARLERAYSMAKPTEYVGTADYLRVEDGCVMVVDLKTGMAEVTAPGRNPQLRFLALAACRANGLQRARVGILHAPEGRTPWWNWAELDAFELEVVAMELRKLAERIGYARAAVEKNKAPWLNAGEHCQWCPARFACPARVGMAKAMASDPSGYALSLKHGLEDDNIASMALARWQAARRILDEVGAALHARAKERPIPTADGMVWGPVESTREVIDGGKAYLPMSDVIGDEAARAAMSFDTSKAGIERGVKAAKAAGTWSGTIKAGVAAVMEAVRAAGAVEVKTRTEYQEHTAAPLGIGPGGERGVDGEGEGRSSADNSHHQLAPAASEGAPF